MSSPLRLFAVLAALVVGLSGCTAVEQLFLGGDTIRYEATVELSRTELHAATGEDDAWWDTFRAQVEAGDTNAINDLLGFDAGEADTSAELLGDDTVRIVISNEGLLANAVSFIADTPGALQGLSYTINDRDLIRLEGDPSEAAGDIIGDLLSSDDPFGAASATDAGFDGLTLQTIVSCHDDIIGDATYEAGEAAPEWELRGCDRISPTLRNIGGFAGIAGILVLGAGFVIYFRRSAVDRAVGDGERSDGSAGPLSDDLSDDGDGGLLGGSSTEVEPDR